MENSSNQVRVLVWPSKEYDPRSIKGRGHVELLVSDKCYGFFPDPKTKWRPRDFVEGCTGILLSRSLVSVATMYLWFLTLEGREDDIVDVAKHTELPIVYVFTFQVSVESLRKCASFLDSRVVNPPLYSIRSDQANSRNCQTISREALSEAGIFGESLEDVSPDGLLELLQQKKDPNFAGLTGSTVWQLKPPIFT